MDHTTALIWDPEVQNKWSGCEGLPPDFVQMFLSKLADFKFRSAMIPQVFLRCTIFGSQLQIKYLPPFVYTYPWKKDKPGHLVYL